MPELVQLYILFFTTISDDINASIYYSNIRYIVLQSYIEPANIRTYLEAYYLYEMDPLLLDPFHIDNTFRHNAIINDDRDYKNWLAYNYILEHDVNIKDTSIDTNMQLYDLVGNLYDMLPNHLQQKIVSDFHSFNWSNFTTYFIYLKYHYFSNKDAISTNFKRFLVKFILEIYPQKFEFRWDYAPANAFLRLKFPLRRANVASKYSYYRNAMTDNMTEIAYAEQGKIWTKSRRPFLMQMIAAQGISIGRDILAILEDYFMAGDSEPRLYMILIEPILRALLVKNGISYQLSYALSPDQMLGVLYTGVFPNMSRENNLLYNYRQAGRINYNVTTIPPQFSVYLYYSRLAELKMVSVVQLINLLGENASKYHIVNFNHHARSITISSEIYEIDMLIRELATYLRPLDDKQLMNDLFHHPVIYASNRLLLSEISRVSYADFILNNEDLAHKYGVKNIYNRLELINIIMGLKIEARYSISFYIRLEEYVTGDNKLWDVKNKQELKLPGQYNKLELGGQAFIINDINARSLIDATDCLNDPNNLMTITCYNSNPII